MSGVEELDRALDTDNQHGPEIPPPQAEDPGDFNQRRRLREIADHEREARNQLIHAEAYGGAEELALAFAAVKVLAQHLQWPIARHGDEKYYERQLGTITVEPPAKLKRIANPRHTEPVRIDQGPVTRVWGEAPSEPKTYPVVGLLPVPEAVGAEQPNGRPFTRLPAGVVADWSVTVDVRQTPQEIEFTAKAPIPLEITSSAYELCSKFLSEAGLDVRSEAERDESSPPI